MAAKKKQQPSKDYLDALLDDQADEYGRFSEAKSKLYQILAGPDGKLFNHDFESARAACLDSNKKMNEIESEILRVKLALKRLGVIN